MEITIAVFIVAILVAVTIPVIQNQLKKSNEYSYYLAYKTVEKLGGQITALGDPDYASYAEPASKNKIAKFNKQKSLIALSKKKHPFISFLKSKFTKTEMALFKKLFPKAYADTMIKLNLFDNSDVVELEFKYKVCVKNELIDYECSPSKLEDESNDEYNDRMTHCYKTDINGNTVYNNRYYTKEDLGCDSIETEDESGNTVTRSYQDSDLYNEAANLMPETYCLNKELLCLSSDDDQSCDMEINKAREDAGKVFINDLNYINICNNIKNKNYCGGKSTEYVSLSDENEDKICYLNVPISSYAQFSESESSWELEIFDDDVCSSSRGYYNMYNAGAPYKVDCQCNDDFDLSDNNPRVCCSIPPVNNIAYAKSSSLGNCVNCPIDRDFNPKDNYCCPKHSIYNSSTQQCECSIGYDDNGTSGPSLVCTRSSCPAGMQLDNGVCVPAAPLVSAKRFCELIADNWNISSKACNVFTFGSNNEQYYEDVYNAAYKNDILNSISAASGAFKNIKPNIVFSNGLSLWILGDRAASIPGLTYDPTSVVKNQNMCVDKNKSTQAACDSAGGYFCSSEKHCYTLSSSSDLDDARNCCSASVSLAADADERAMAISGFTVYVDINGKQGSGTLWDDVFPFYVGSNGKVYPAYPLDASNPYIGGNNAGYLPTDVYYYKANSSSRKRVLAYAGISYANAVCKAGFINAYSPYCLNGNLKSNESGTNPCNSNKCFITVRRKHSFL